MPHILLILVPMVVVLVYSFVSFDKFVRIEYETNREAWIADGKPGGFFWSVPEESSYSTALAGQMLSVKVAYKTPEWARQNPEALQCLNRMRIASLFGIALGIIGFLINAFS